MIFPITQLQGSYIHTMQNQQQLKVTTITNISYGILDILSKKMAISSLYFMAHYPEAIIPISSAFLSGHLYTNQKPFIRLIKLLTTTPTWVIEPRKQ